MENYLEQKINDGISKIRPFSEVVQCAIGLIDSNICDNKHLATILKRDPILSARLLSLANSPFYGLNRKIGGIENACIILGNNVIRNMLVSVGALQCFPITKKRNQIWTHSIEVAATSEILADMSHQSVGMVYMAGLLHDIGKFLLLDLFPEQQEEIGTFQSIYTENAIEEEIKYFGINHAQVGAKIIEVWNLPKEIQSIVEMHHYPNKASQPETCCIISLADEICIKLKMELPDSEILGILDNNNIDYPNIKPQQIENTLPDIKSKIESIHGTLELLI